jgi:hypothetical protein
MKAVVGLLLIFLGGAIDYFVITGKLPPQGGIVPPATSAPPLPTASSTSSGFAATTGQGNTSGNSSTYLPPPVRGAGIPT